MKILKTAACCVLIFGCDNGKNSDFIYPPEAETITIDVSASGTDISHNPTGFCLSFFNDNPKNFESATTSFPDAIRATGAGSLRYPMGTLGENYLFHQPGDYDNAVNGLRPMVASLQELPKNAIFQNAVDAGGFYNSKILGFDDLMALCRETGTQPVIMVSAQGHLFPGSTVSYQDMITNAAEWVRYANVTNNYNVKYWEIGNEIDNQIPLMTAQEYGVLLKDYYIAMKEVDPTVKIGAGLHTKKDYYRYIAKNYSDYLDFFVTHLYMMEGVGSESQYRNSTSDFISKYRDFSSIVDQELPAGKNVGWMISEYSSFIFQNDPFGDKNTMLKGMASFERLAGMISFDDRIVYTHFWVTHSPWRNIMTDADAFDNNNNLTPQARSVQMIGTFLQDRMLQVKRVTGMIRAFASYSSGSNKLTVWLLNKGEEENQVNLNIVNMSGTLTQQHWEYAGKSLQDENPKYTGYPKIAIGNSRKIKITTRPNSINALVFENH
jgi:alpha-L-arabinofuranosidase